MATEKLTDKNTKSEILKAYNEVLAELKDKQRAPQKIQQEEKKQEIVAQAEKHTPDILIKGLTELKLNISKSLGDVGEKIAAEYERLAIIEEAIRIQNQTLKERHEIITNANTLEALILAQAREKEEFELNMEERKLVFEQEVADKRAVWKKEMERMEQERKETEVNLKKERSREEEEYNYKLKLHRQKDADDYATRKQQLEKALEDKRLIAEKAIAEREASLQASESELKELREKVTAFPEQLATAVAETEQKVTERSETYYKYEMSLKEKETQGEVRLYQQTISSLETKIKEQEDLIQQLTQKTNQANAQVQEIAVRAIDGASGLRHYNQYFDRTIKNDNGNEKPKQM